VVDIEDESLSELESSLSLTFALADFLTSDPVGFDGLLAAVFLTYFEEGTSSEDEEELEDEDLPVFFF